LVFALPQGALYLNIRIVGTDLQGQTVLVHVAARLHPENTYPGPYSQSLHAVTGTVDSLPQPCNPGGPKPLDQVTRVLPVTYTDAYGSRPFAPPLYTGFQLSNIVHTIYQSTVLGGGSFTITGVALRSWAPFNSGTASPQLYQVNLVGIAQTSSVTPVTPNPPNVTFDTVYPGFIKAVSPPGYSVSLSQDAYPPKQVARSWNEWTIPIPLQVPYTYNPQHTNGPHLAVWLELVPNAILAVDAINDGAGSPVATAGFQPNFASIVGLAPMLGLVLSGTGNPTLTCYGTPEIGQRFILHAQNFGTSHAGIPFLLFGPHVAPLGLLLPSTSNCLLQWPNNNPYVQQLSWIPHSGSAIWAWQFPPMTNLLFTDTYAQVAELTINGFVQSTNALRLRIGGPY
jgi:hypothetical protein